MESDEKGCDQNLSVHRNAKRARKMAAVAPHAAVGGYAISRHFQSTVLGPTNKTRADCVIAAQRRSMTHRPA